MRHTTTPYTIHRIFSRTIIAWLFASSAAAYPFSTSPSVSFGSSSIIGTLFQLSKVEFFGGIPYAEAPVGQLRLRSPVLRYDLPSRVFQANTFGPSCLQNEIPSDTVSEDCLSLNIFRPANIPENARVPVMVWIYGGAFFVGGSSLYNATSLVSRSVSRGTPVIVVSLNYRVGPLGFPQGIEVGQAGHEAMNLGIQDFITALQWIQNNIELFGGDKAKVTLFGESSGAFMINILLRHTKFSGLARAAILESMEILPVFGPERSEAIWQQYVSSIPGCKTAASTNSTIACVRTASSSAVLQAMTTAGLNFGDFMLFQPVIDGPNGLIVDRQSQIAPNQLGLPIMIGTNLDEGTVFVPQNVNSEDQIVGFLEESSSPTLASVTQLTQTRVINTIMQLYPDNPSLGSPFGTGNNTFGLNSEYKRFSAILGDVSIQAARRTYTQKTSAAGSKVFAYLFTDLDATTIIPEITTGTASPGSLGVPHSAEIFFVFNTMTKPTPITATLSITMQDYWISFAVNMDPNDNHGNINRPQWQQYTPVYQKLLELNGRSISMIPDTFREQQIAFIQSNSDPIHV